MGSEFRELVDMYRVEANRTNELFNELNVLKDENHRLERDLAGAIKQIKRLKADVGTALHGRINQTSDTPKKIRERDECSSAMPWGVRKIERGCICFHQANNPMPGDVHLCPCGCGVGVSASFEPVR